MKQIKKLNLALLSMVLLTAVELVHASSGMRRAATSAGAQAAATGSRSLFTRYGKTYIAPNEKQELAKIFADDPHAKVRVVSDNPQDYYIKPTRGYTGSSDSRGYMTNKKPDSGFYAPVSEISLDPVTAKLVVKPVEPVRVLDMKPRSEMVPLVSAAPEHGSSGYDDFPDRTPFSFNVGHNSDFYDENVRAVDKVLKKPDNPLVASKVFEGETVIDSSKLTTLHDFRAKHYKMVHDREEAARKRVLEEQKVKEAKEAAVLKEQEEKMMQERIARENAAKKYKSDWARAKLAIENDFDNIFKK